MAELQATGVGAESARPRRSGPAPPAGLRDRHGRRGPSDVDSGFSRTTISCRGHSPRWEGHDP
jgi:hypothetical protein